MNRRNVVSLVCAGVAILAAAVPGPAWALTTVEGAAIGDQGFYWTTPAEVWIFPHRLGNNDNEVMLQYGSPGPGALYNVASAPSFDGSTNSIQTGIGGGFVLELMKDLNLGMWFSGYNPATNGFVGRGVTAMGWDTYVSPGLTGNLQTVDPYDPTALGFEAGRKLDLFASYWLSDLGVETGLHLWWGSAHHEYAPDDSAGPINIDADSDPNTGDAIGVDDPRGDKYPIKEGNYGLTDFGLGLGAGFSGVTGFRADAGIDFNILGVSWTPNGISDYVSAGGFGLGLNLRSHYDVSDTVTVGGFMRYAQAGMSMKPKRQRDGGQLTSLYQPTDPDELSDLDDPTLMPPGSDPAAPGNEQTPVDGIKYAESGKHFQVAGLVQVKPNSRAKLYAALGTRYESSLWKVSINGSDWYYQEATSHFTLPFIHVGFEGKVMEHLSVLMGATKQWRGTTLTTKAFDSRIPDLDTPRGPSGTTATAGQEDYTNAKRRLLETKDDTDDPGTSTTALMLGTRISYGPVQLVGQLDPTFLTHGPYFLSGSPSTMWFWVSLVYDWDYDQDAESGNGTVKVTPHEAAKEAAPAAAPAPSTIEPHLPAKPVVPTPIGGQEFDS